MSVFNSDEFCRGFIELCDSDSFNRYMVPFINEMIENARGSLEDGKGNDERLRGGIAILRRIKDEGDFQKKLRLEKARGE